MSCLIYQTAHLGSCLGLWRHVTVSGLWPTAVNPSLTGVRPCCPSVLQEACAALTEEKNKTYPDVRLGPPSHNHRCDHRRNKWPIRKTSSRRGGQTLKIKQGVSSRLGRNWNPHTRLTGGKMVELLWRTVWQLHKRLNTQLLDARQFHF